MRPWALALIALAALAVWHLLEARGSRRADEADRQFAAAIAIAHRAGLDRAAVLARADTVDGLLAGERARRAQEARRAAAAQLAAQAAESALEAATGAADSLLAFPPLVSALRGVISADSAEKQSLRASLRLALGDRAHLRWALEQAGAATDSLVTALEAVNRARTCRLGVGPVSVGCPSRLTGAALGVLAGGLIGVALR